MKSVNLNQDGISMFNILIMVATAGALLLSTAGYHKDNTIFRKAAVKSATRSNLNAILAQYATAPSSIRNSMMDPENSRLKDCVMGTGGCACDKAYPLKLLGPFADSPVIADSTEKSGAKFDVFGHYCDNKYAVNCPFEVVVSFEKVCATGAIKVNYQVNEAIFSDDKKVGVSEALVTSATMPVTAILATGISYEQIYVATGGTMSSTTVTSGTVTSDPSVTVTGPATSVSGMSSGETTTVTSGTASSN
jgi:hypothetical protein